MQHAQLLTCVSLTLAQLASFSVAGTTQATPAPTAQISLSGSELPTDVVWTAEQGTQAFKVDPESGMAPLTVQAGEGCLVLARAGYLPQVGLLELAVGKTTQVGIGPWRRGTTIRGSVESRSLLLVTANLELVDTTPRQPLTDKRCKLALGGLGLMQASTLADGTFLVGPVAGGVYSLLVRAPDHAGRDLRVVVDDRAGEELTLEAISLDAIAILVVAVDATDVTEQPPFRLVIERERPGWLREAERWAHEGTDEIGPGEERQLGLSPGFYRLTLSKPSGDLAFTQHLELHAGEQRVTLRPQPFYVEGKVTRAGEAVEGVEVTLVAGAVESSTSTSPLGTFHLRVWAADDYGLFARSRSGGTLMDHVDLREARAGETTRHDIELSAATIRGTVVAKENQQAISGASVSLAQSFTQRESASMRSTTAAADGTFEFVGVEESEHTKVSARAKGFLEGGQDVAITNGQTEYVFIQLEAVDAILGRVVAHTGQPVAGATVGCCAPAIDGLLQQSAKTGLDGTFQLDARDGSVIFAMAPSCALGWAVAQGDTTLVTLSPRPAPTRVRLTTGDREPAMGALVTVISDDGIAVPFDVFFQAARLNGCSSYTDASGELDICGLAAGHYQLLVRTAQGPRPLGDIVVPAPGRVELSLPPL